MKRKITPIKTLKLITTKGVNSRSQLEQYISDYRGMVTITPKDRTLFQELYSKPSANAYSIVQTIIHHKRESHPVLTNPMRQIAI